MDRDDERERGGELRRRADAARAEATEQRYRMLFDSIDQGFCVIEMLFGEAGEAIGYRFVEANAAFEKQTGLKDVVGRTTLELVPDLERYWIENYARVDRTRRSERFENQVGPFGRWYDACAFPMGEPDEHRLSVLFSDISDRIEREAALRESRERFQALVTAGTYSTYRMSADWRVMYALDSDTLAVTSDPIVDWVDKYILPEDLPVVRAAIDRAIATRSLFELEHRVRLADGGVGWVRSRAVPLIGADGEIGEWFGTGADVTERRAATERLRESEARQKFLLALSDALRSSDDPDAVIATATRMLGERLNASRVVFAEIDEAAGTAAIRPGWVAEGAQVHPATLKLEAFGGPLLHDLRAGKTVRFDDAGEPPYVRADLAALAAIGVKAGLSVPLLIEDRFVMNVSVHRHEPRGWTDEEVALVEQVAERLWPALQRARVQGALRERERDLARVQRIGRVGGMNIDVAGGMTSWRSPEYLRLHGLPAGRRSETHADWRRRVHPDDVEAAEQDLFAALAGSDPVYENEYRIIRPSDGEVRWIQARADIERDAGGTALRLVGAHLDITEQKEAAARQKLLLAELQHRVRNILGVVRSVFGRTVRAATDLEDAADHFRGRLDSMARTQVILTQNVRGTVDLENLIRDELLSVGAAGDDRITIEGPDVELTGKVAEAIALAIHELTTNALKYGALKVSGAQLTIIWSVDIDCGGARTLRLTWTEQGVPAIAVKPIRTGFGTELIVEAMPYRLGAETKFEFRSGGVRCSIILPLA